MEKRTHQRYRESYYFLLSKVVDSIYLSVRLSADLKFLPEAKPENDLHDAWFVVCAAAPVLVLLCLCCIEELLGLAAPLFLRVETRIAPFGAYRPRHPEPDGTGSTRCERRGTLNINPSKLSLGQETAAKIMEVLKSVVKVKQGFN